MDSIGPVIQTLQLPRTLFGAGALSALPEQMSLVHMQRPLLVTDQGLVRIGLVAKLVAAIGNAAPVAVFDGVNENPIFANVDDAGALYKREGCDGVIALGGGSPIDTSKAVAMLANNPGSIADYAGVPDAVILPPAPLIVIPTTAGTGSEASNASGLHPTPTSLAAGLFSPHLFPLVAILDPELTLSLPPRLTAATGIDALSHCIEGYLSKFDLPLADPVALSGIARVVRNIRRAVADGGDIGARSEMLLAAYEGGVALSLGLGPAHAIAIVCGDQGFHHGILSGIGMVAALDLMAARQPERAAALGKAFGLETGASLAKAVEALMRELGLPASLRELGYKTDDIPKLARQAHENFFNAFASYHPTEAEYAEMLTASLQ